MGKHLDRAVAALVDEQLNARLGHTESSVSLPEGEVDEIRAHLIASFRDEVQKEFVAEYGSEVRQQIQAEEQERAAKDRALRLLDQTKALLLDGIFVAFLVGLVVNQFTDLLSQFKSDAATPMFWTLLFLAVGVWATFRIALYRLTKLSVKLLSEVTHSSHGTSNHSG